MNFSKPLAVFGLVALGVSGCATYVGSPVQHRDAGQFGNVLRTGGVQAGAEALAPTRAKEMLYLDVTTQGYVPVEASVVNSSDSRRVLRRDRIELIAPGGSAVRPVGSREMSADFEKNKLTYALLGLGVFSYMSVDEANKKMAADWAAKELASESVIAPGQRASGLVYFRLPSGGSAVGAELVLPIENPDTGATETIRLRL